MTEAYVLAGELARNGGTAIRAPSPTMSGGCAHSSRASRNRLAALTASFTPRTALGYMALRNQVSRA